jgi:hypothetical protein
MRHSQFQLAVEIYNITSPHMLHFNVSNSIKIIWLRIFLLKSNLFLYSAFLQLQ